MMTEKAPSTQDMILLATIDCINEHNLDQITTRMIAEKAGANIASINYYFRTKEILINQALEVTIKHMLEDVIETLENDQLNFRQILHDVFYYLISGAHQNLGVSSAHLYRLVVEKDYDSVSAKSFLQAFNNVLARGVEALPEQEPERLKRILASIFSAIMFMMLTPFFFQPNEDSGKEEEPYFQQMADHYTEMFYAMV